MNPSCPFYFRIYSETEYFIQPCQLCPYSDQAKDRTPRSPSSIPGKSPGSCPKRPDPFWVPHSLLLDGYQGTLRRGYKQPSGEADPSSRSTVEIKNKWSYTLFFPIACTVDTENFSHCFCTLTYFVGPFGRTFKPALV